MGTWQGVRLNLSHIPHKESTMNTIKNGHKEFSNVSKPKYIRTVEAPQTAYVKDNHAGFWLFIAAMTGAAAWAASVIF